MYILHAGLASYRFAEARTIEGFTPQDVDLKPAGVFEPAPLPPLPDPGQIPFPALAFEDARQALRAFHESRHAPWIGIDVETGLPSYLHGDLADPVDRDLWDASADFLHRHELLLSGVRDEVSVQPEHAYRWLSGTTQIEWRQTNRAGVPVYGCAATLTYTGRRLTFLANTLHPASSQELDAFIWDEAWPGRLLTLAAGDEQEGESELKNLPEKIHPVTFEPPWDLRGESAERGWLADRWILPFLAAVPAVPWPELPMLFSLDLPPVRFTGPGVYRPVWRTVAVDAQGDRWLLLVDAETYEVLTVERTRVGSTLTTDVYRSPADAAALPPTPQSAELDFGSGAEMATAQYVRLSGARFADPAGAGAGDTAEMAARRLLTATVYYQARRAQIDFGAVLSDLVLDVAVTLPPPAVADPTAMIAASLDDTGKSAEYDFQTRTIHLGRGFAAVGGSPPVPAVRDPGFDGDVMLHEFSHAITRFLKPVVFEYRNHNNWKEVLTRQLDEGQAFYFGCSFAQDARWSEYAFADWQNLRNLAEPGLAPASVPPDPFGIVYQIGMWWARVFWALGQAPNIQADLLILKALASLAGPLTSPQVMLHTLLDPTEQYGALNDVRAVLQGTGFAL